MNIVFCHGVFDPNENWETREFIPITPWAYWLQLQIEKNKDINMQIPLFPHSHELLMKYDEWEKIMDRQDINSDTTLIGHSAGGGFILKYMAQHPELRVRQIVLVAPWVDVENHQPFGFYKDFTLDSGILNHTRFGADIFISSDDDPYILSSVDKITQKISDIRVHKFSGRGHFVCDQLPEILNIIK